ncbi:MAG: imidazoleglycerol-phosphate dehydratase [Methanomassiliicoccales archaeon]|nr:imidazoleglycerol-phosphate dehydratase [Methanomassiliicoccales archaeon]
MKQRVHSVRRETKETQIVLSLNADGRGICEFDSEGLQMVGHMVNTLARYSSFDISVKAKGDMVHHTSEDVAICLGIAMKKCIDDWPVKRTGYAVVPMDDALVQVAVDLSGRSYFSSDELAWPFEHFLSSFASNAAINLHVVVVRGKDEHHVVEAAFKALGLSLRQAMERRDGEVSAKGSVLLEVDDG